MYYLELIQRFWEFNKVAKISPTEISLYFYLLKIGYSKDRYDFKISDVELGKKLGLTRKTIKSTKEKLKKLGLIEFKTVNGVPCYYRLLLNYSFVINCKNEYSKTEISQESEISVISSHGNILSAQNELELESEIETRHDAKFSSEISKIQEKEDEKEQHIFINRSIPSFDEFMEYAKSLENYEPKLELSISDKYGKWKNNDWKNNYGRSISNWKSTLKSTLPYLINNSIEDFLSIPEIPNIKHSQF